MVVQVVPVPARQRLHDTASLSLAYSASAFRSTVTMGSPDVGASAGAARLREIERPHEGRVQRRSDSAKGALEAFCNQLERKVTDVVRLVRRREAERGRR